jgi:hypothetical protein
VTADRDGDLRRRVRRLESDLGNLLRWRTGNQPRFRDLQDASLTKIKDGQVPTFDADLGRFVPGGAGKPYATVVVASGDIFSPSTAAGAASADFVTDETSADSALQAAFDYIAATDWPNGEIVLLEGQYPITGNPEVPYGVAVRGMGTVGANLYRSSGSGPLLTTNGGCVLSHLHLDGGGDICVQSYSDADILTELFIEGAVDMRGGYSRMFGCEVRDGGVTNILAGAYCLWALNEFLFNAAGTTVRMSGSYDSFFANVVTTDDGGGTSAHTGVEVASGAEGESIAHNRFVGVHHDPCVDVLAGATGTIVVPNDFRGATTAIADAGTGTVTTWPTGGSGANFT